MQNFLLNRVFVLLKFVLSGGYSALGDKSDTRMLKPSVKAMFKGKASRYALVMGVAKRAREITVELQDTIFESVKGKNPVKLAEKDFRDSIDSSSEDVPGRIRYCILHPDINN